MSLTQQFALLLLTILAVQHSKCTKSQSSHIKPLPSKDEFEMDHGWMAKKEKNFEHHVMKRFFGLLDYEALLWPWLDNDDKPRRHCGKNSYIYTTQKTIKKPTQNKIKTEPERDRECEAAMTDKLIKEARGQESKDVLKQIIQGCKNNILVHPPSENQTTTAKFVTEITTKEPLTDTIKTKPPRGKPPSRKPKPQITTTKSLPQLTMEHPFSETTITNPPIHQTNPPKITTTKSISTKKLFTTTIETKLPSTTEYIELKRNTIKHENERPIYDFETQYQEQKMHVGNPENSKPTQSENIQSSEKDKSSKIESAYDQNTRFTNDPERRPTRSKPNIDIHMSNENPSTETNPGKPNEVKKPKNEKDPIYDFETEYKKPQENEWEGDSNEKSISKFDSAYTQRPTNSDELTSINANTEETTQIPDVFRQLSPNNPEYNFESQYHSNFTEFGNPENGGTSSEFESVYDQHTQFVREPERRPTRSKPNIDIHMSNENPSTETNPGKPNEVKKPKNEKDPIYDFETEYKKPQENEWEGDSNEKSISKFDSTYTQRPTNSDELTSINANTEETTQIPDVFRQLSPNNPEYNFESQYHSNFTEFGNLENGGTSSEFESVYDQHTQFVREPERGPTRSKPNIDIHMSNENPSTETNPGKPNEVKKPDNEKDPIYDFETEYKKPQENEWEGDSNEKLISKFDSAYTQRPTNSDELTTINANTEETTQIPDVFRQLSPNNPEYNFESQYHSNFTEFGNPENGGTSSEFESVYDQHTQFVREPERRPTRSKPNIDIHMSNENPSTETNPGKPNEVKKPKNEKDPIYDFETEYKKPQENEWEGDSIEKSISKFDSAYTQRATNSDELTSINANTEETTQIPDVLSPPGSNRTNKPEYNFESQYHSNFTEFGNPENGGTSSEFESVYDQHTQFVREPERRPTRSKPNIDIHMSNENPSTETNPGKPNEVNKHKNEKDPIYDFETEYKKPQQNEWEGDSNEKSISKFDSAYTQRPTNSDELTSINANTEETTQIPDVFRQLSPNNPEYNFESQYHSNFTEFGNLENGGTSSEFESVYDQHTQFVREPERRPTRSKPNIDIHMSNENPSTETNPGKPNEVKKPKNEKDPIYDFETEYKKPQENEWEGDSNEKLISKFDSAYTQRPTNSDELTTINANTEETTQIPDVFRQLSSNNPEYNFESQYHSNFTEFGNPENGGTSSEFESVYDQHTQFVREPERRPTRSKPNIDIHMSNENPSTETNPGKPNEVKKPKNEKDPIYDFETEYKKPQENEWEGDSNEKSISKFDSAYTQRPTNSDELTSINANTEETTQIPDVFRQLSPNNPEYNFESQYHSNFTEFGNPENGGTSSEFESVYDQHTQFVREPERRPTRSKPNINIHMSNENPSTETNPGKPNEVKKPKNEKDPIYDFETEYKKPQENEWEGDSNEKSISKFDSTYTQRPTNSDELTSINANTEETTQIPDVFRQLSPNNPEYNFESQYHSNFTEFGNPENGGTSSEFESVYDQHTQFVREPERRPTRSKPNIDIHMSNENPSTDTNPGKPNEVNKHKNEKDPIYDFETEYKKPQQNEWEGDSNEKLISKFDSAYTQRPTNSDELTSINANTEETTQIPDVFRQLSPNNPEYNFESQYHSNFTEFGNHENGGTSSEFESVYDQHTQFVREPERRPTRSKPNIDIHMSNENPSTETNPGKPNEVKKPKNEKDPIYDFETEYKKPQENEWEGDSNEKSISKFDSTYTQRPTNSDELTSINANTEETTQIPDVFRQLSPNNPEYNFESQYHSNFTEFGNPENGGTSSEFESVYDQHTQFVREPERRPTRSKPNIDIHMSNENPSTDTNPGKPNEVNKHKNEKDPIYDFETEYKKPQQNEWEGDSNEKLISKFDSAYTQRPTNSDELTSINANTEETTQIPDVFRQLSPNNPEYNFESQYHSNFTEFGNHENGGTSSEFESVYDQHTQFVREPERRPTRSKPNIDIHMSNENPSTETNPGKPNEVKKPKIEKDPIYDFETEYKKPQENEWEGDSNEKSISKFDSAYTQRPTNSDELTSINANTEKTTQILDVLSPPGSNRTNKPEYNFESQYHSNFTEFGNPENGGTSSEFESVYDQHTQFVREPERRPTRSKPNIDIHMSNENPSTETNPGKPNEVKKPKNEKDPIYDFETEYKKPQENEWEGDSNEKSISKFDSAYTQRPTKSDELTSINANTEKTTQIPDVFGQLSPNNPEYNLESQYHSNFTEFGNPENGGTSSEFESVYDQHTQFVREPERRPTRSKPNIDIHMSNENPSTETNPGKPNEVKKPKNEKDPIYDFETEYKKPQENEWEGDSNEKSISKFDSAYTQRPTKSDELTSINANTEKTTQIPDVFRQLSPNNPEYNFESQYHSNFTEFGNPENGGTSSEFESVYDQHTQFVREPERRPTRSKPNIDVHMSNENPSTETNPGKPNEVKKPKNEKDPIYDFESEYKKPQENEWEGDSNEKSISKFDSAYTQRPTKSDELTSINANTEETTQIPDVFGQLSPNNPEYNFESQYHSNFTEFGNPENGGTSSEFESVYDQHTQVVKEPERRPTRRKPNNDIPMSNENPSTDTNPGKPNEVKKPKNEKDPIYDFETEYKKPQENEWEGDSNEKLISKFDSAYTQRPTNSDELTTINANTEETTQIPDVFRQLSSNNPEYNFESQYHSNFTEFGNPENGGTSSEFESVFDQHTQFVREPERRPTRSKPNNDIHMSNENPSTDTNPGKPNEVKTPKNEKDPIYDFETEYKKPQQNEWEGDSNEKSISNFDSAYTQRPTNSDELTSINANTEETTQIPDVFGQLSPNNPEYNFESQYHSNFTEFGNPENGGTSFEFESVYDQHTQVVKEPERRPTRRKPNNDIHMSNENPSTETNTEGKKPYNEKDPIYDFGSKYEEAHKPQQNESEREIIKASNSEFNSAYVTQKAITKPTPPRVTTTLEVDSNIMTHNSEFDSVYHQNTRFAKEPERRPRRWKPNNVVDISNENPNTETNPEGKKPHNEKDPIYDFGSKYEEAHKPKENESERESIEASNSEFNSAYDPDPRFSGGPKRIRITWTSEEEPETFETTVTQKAITKPTPPRVTTTLEVDSNVMTPNSDFESVYHQNTRFAKEPERRPRRWKPNNVVDISNENPNTETNTEGKKPINEKDPIYDFGSKYEEAHKPKENESERESIEASNSEFNSAYDPDPRFSGGPKRIRITWTSEEEPETFEPTVTQKAITKPTPPRVKTTLEVDSNVMTPNSDFESVYHQNTRFAKEPERRPRRWKPNNVVDINNENPNTETNTEGKKPINEKDPIYDFGSKYEEAHKPKENESERESIEASNSEFNSAYDPDPRFSGGPQRIRITWTSEEEPEIFEPTVTQKAITKPTPPRVTTTLEVDSNVMTPNSDFESVYHQKTRFAKEPERRPRMWKPNNVIDISNENPNTETNPEGKKPNNEEYPIYDFALEYKKHHNPEENQWEQESIKESNFEFNSAYDPDQRFTGGLQRIRFTWTFKEEHETYEPTVTQKAITKPTPPRFTTILEVDSNVMTPNSDFESVYHQNTRFAKEPERRPRRWKPNNVVDISNENPNTETNTEGKKPINEKDPIYDFGSKYEEAHKPKENESERESIEASNSEFNSAYDPDPRFSGGPQRIRITWTSEEEPETFEPTVTQKAITRPTLPRFTTTLEVDTNVMTPNSDFESVYHQNTRFENAPYRRPKRGTHDCKNEANNGDDPIYDIASEYEKQPMNESVVKTGEESSSEFASAYNHDPLFRNEPRLNHRKKKHDNKAERNKKKDRHKKEKIPTVPVDKFPQQFDKNYENHSYGNERFIQEK